MEREFNATFPGGYVYVKMETNDAVSTAERKKLGRAAAALAQRCKNLSQLVDRRPGCKDHTLSRILHPECKTGKVTVTVTGEITAVELDQSKVDKIIVWS